MSGAAVNGAYGQTIQRHTDCLVILEPCSTEMLPKQILHRHIGVSHDLSQEALAERPSGMEWHRRPASIGMTEDDVAPTLSDGEEPVAVQDVQHLLPCQGREARAHNATRTLVAATSWQMGSPLAIRSSICRRMASTIRLRASASVSPSV